MSFNCFLIALFTPSKFKEPLTKLKFWRYDENFYCRKQSNDASCCDSNIVGWLWEPFILHIVSVVIWMRLLTIFLVKRALFVWILKINIVFYVYTIGRSSWEILEIRCLDYGIQSLVSIFKKSYLIKKRE